MLRLNLEEILMIIIKKKNYSFSQLNHNICLGGKRINGDNRLQRDKSLAFLTLES